MLVDGLLHDLELYKPRVLVKAELRDSSITKRFITHCNSQGEAIKSEILDISEQTMFSHEAGRDTESGRESGRDRGRYRGRDREIGRAHV